MISLVEGGAGLSVAVRTSASAKAGASPITPVKMRAPSRAEISSVSPSRAIARGKELDRKRTRTKKMRNSRLFMAGQSLADAASDAGGFGDEDDAYLQYVLEAECKISAWLLAAFPGACGASSTWVIDYARGGVRGVILSDRHAYDVLSCRIGLLESCRSETRALSGVAGSAELARALDAHLAADGYVPASPSLSALLEEAFRCR